MIRHGIGSRALSPAGREFGQLLATLAVLAVVLTATVRPTTAAPTDGGPPIVEQPPNGEVDGLPRRLLSTTTTTVDGVAYWVVKGRFFSSQRVDLVAVDLATGEPVRVVDGFFSAYGPSFSIVTNARSCKNVPGSVAYRITATDQGTGLASNSVVITTC
jgi:hypothetical protein